MSKYNPDLYDTDPNKIAFDINAIPGNYIATVECVCGRQISQVNEVQPVTCKCGAAISLIVEENGTITPTGIVPDGYDYDRRRKLYIVAMGVNE